MDGFIIVNKPSGLTSFDCVFKMKKVFKTKQVGHTGTLDPMTTGVLVIAINKATKLMELTLDKKKKYLAQALIGYTTDTLDVTGNTLTSVDSVSLTKDKVLEALDKISKSKTQIPPMYSAIKVNGKKLYEYARKGITIERKPRPINIDYIKLTSELNELDNYITFDFEVLADSGIYVRSLIEDIGTLLGYPATMSKLCRKQSGKFDIKDSYTLEQIEQGDYKLITIEEIFSDYPKIEVNDYIAHLVKNGVMLDERQANFDSIFRVYHNNKLIALYKPTEVGYKIVVYLGE